MNKVKFFRDCKKLFFWVFILISLFIITSSFLPYHLNEKQKIAGHTIRLDYLLHLFVYAALSFSFLSSLKKTFGLKMLSLYILAALVFSFGLESLQVLIPYRTFNILDVLFNGLGILLGLGVWKVVRKQKL